MEKLILAGRALGPIGANCYILGSGATQEAAVIDPGVPDPWIQETVQKHGLRVRYILLTHAHPDHIGGVEAVKAWSGAPVLLHAAEADWPQDPRKNLSAFFEVPIVAPAPDRLLAEGDVIELGPLRLKVLHVPGHSPGSACFHLAAAALVIAGDTLFAGGIGRTDFPGCQPELLVPMIRQKLLTLPPQTAVLPGHGPTTTIADEAEFNPFLA